MWRADLLVSWTVRFNHRAALICFLCQLNLTALYFGVPDYMENTRHNLEELWGFDQEGACLISSACTKLKKRV